MWFEGLTGFRESEVADVASMFVVDGDRMTSMANNRSMTVGRFETPSLEELRRRSEALPRRGEESRVREVVADVQELHRDPASAGALFQVASQFNALEMVSEHVTPEAGIDIYEWDPTQGPACAIACGAGTIFRNYLVTVDGQRGQTAERQLDCLADLAAELNVDTGTRNGYALPSRETLDAVAGRLSDADDEERDRLASLLRVAVQWDTEVTISSDGHLVTQTFCSAMPVAYSRHGADAWEPFARLVLDAAYEATLHLGAINAAATGNPTVFLTKLGGSAFGNPSEWILDAMAKALHRCGSLGVDVAIVSYGEPDHRLARLLT